jgi:hypothetical protein
MRPSVFLRRALAFAVTAAACVASVASLDMSAPDVTVTGTSAADTATLPEGDGQFVVHVDADAGASQAIVLTVALAMTWPGFGDAGAGGGGADDQEYPVLQATLPSASTDAGTTLDRAFTSSPGTGALELIATSAGSPDFTLTLTRVTPAPSGPITVKISAQASITDTDPPAQIKVTVSP